MSIRGRVMFLSVGEREKETESSFQFEEREGGDGGRRNSGAAAVHVGEEEENVDREKHGFCNHKKEKIIVYEYLSNESLYQHIQSGKLSWKKRLEISIGAARGLHYLHAGAKRTIIHRNINPSNILLDGNMEPRLADFGLSVQGQRFMSKPKPIKVDSVVGTFGYLAKEHLVDLTITDKTDVYSFGMVLLEVVCGGSYVKRVTEREFLRPVEEKLHPNIEGKIAPECWQVFVEIIQGCVKYEADERPTMGEVEMQLEHALLLQEQADTANTNAEYTLLSKTIIN